MASIPTTTIRIDPEVKKQATEVFDELGIGMSTAINAFLRAAIRAGGMPFDMKVEPTAGASRSGNITLNPAVVATRDEFYTQYDDVAKEMNNYPDDFRRKTVLCNCDDPFESAFFRYFVIHFKELGLSKLISTCYAESSLTGKEYPLKNTSGAYKAVVTTTPHDLFSTPNNALNFKSIFALPGNTLTRLNEDGDFRSDECVALLDEADIVATNPPFSLFREYISQLEEHNKKYIILGNMNASTCKEVFPLFRNDKVWYGESIHSGDRKFTVPDNYPLNASGCGIDDDGQRFIRVKGVRWFTNMDNGRRHKPLDLTDVYIPTNYPRYENYDAIEVNRTSRIPVNYNGIMGVPITFLDKYCPSQFEIIMLANGNARTNSDPATLAEVGYKPHPEDRGGVGIINGKRAYARILIRRRNS